MTTLILHIYITLTMLLLDIKIIDRLNPTTFFKKVVIHLFISVTRITKKDTQQLAFWYNI